MSARAPRGFRFPETGESPSAERPWLICLGCERPIPDYPPARTGHRTFHRLEVRRVEHEAIRTQVFDRDDYRCALRDVTGAGRCYGPLTPHHRRKAGQGGAYSLDNLVTLCRHHNDALESHPDLALLGERLGLVVRRVPRVDLDAEDRTRHRRDRVASAAADGWALDCSAAGGPAISAALSQAAETLDVAS